MGKQQRSSMRQVPWQSWEHWEWVATHLFSASPDRVSAALDKIAAWQSRGNVPIAVEVSAALIGIHQRDPQVSPGVPEETALPEELLRMMYAMAIQRLVNGVVDQSKKRNIASVADRAELAGLPRLLVDIRHETAHTELPGLSLLHVASKQALAWLKVRYWDQQRETLVSARVELKAKLVEHCGLVIEVLHASAYISDDQQSKEEDMPEEADDLQDPMSQEALAERKQRRTAQFSDLLDLSLSSTSDLLSILVDDGMLEQETLSSQDEADGKQPLGTDSSEGSDLALATTYAWKFTLKQLSSHMPRLPGLLLKEIIQKIDTCCSQSDSPQRQAHQLGLMTVAKTSDKLRETSETGAFKLVKIDRLILWCAWLLGKKSMPDSSHLTGQQPTKSKLLKTSTVQSVKAEFGKELLRELLRKCLCTSNARGPLTELVPLIAALLGNKRFQVQASALAQLGTSMWRVHNNLTDRLDETGSMALEERMHDSPSETVVSVATPSHPREEENLLHEPRSSQDCYETRIAASESAFVVAWTQKKEFLKRFSMRKSSLSSSNNCGRDGHTGNTESGLPKIDAAISTLPEMGTDKYREDGNTQLLEMDTIFSTRSPHTSVVAPVENVIKGGKWSVVENWRPCAIGMIPSKGNVTGMMPSLDFGCQAMVSHQSSGPLGDGNLVMDPGATSKDGLASPDVGKRKTNQGPDSSTVEKRPKKTDRHVHFADGDPVEQVEKVEQIVDGADTELESFATSQVPNPQYSSPMQGCLLLNGVLVKVTPQQVKSFQSAVHVL